jgi:hypothetical protein
MGAIKKVGGLLALVGGAMVLIWAIIFADVFFGAATEIILIKWIVTVALAALALVGGLLGMGTKKLGSFLALIVGLIWTLFWILILAGAVSPTSAIGYLFDISYNFSIVGYYIIGESIIAVEALLIFVGGILMLADRSD